MNIVLHQRKFAKIQRYNGGVGFFMQHKKHNYNDKYYNSIHIYLAACKCGHYNYLKFVEENKTMLRNKFIQFFLEHPEFGVSKNELYSIKYINKIIYDFESLNYASYHTNKPMETAIEFNQYNVVMYLYKIGHQFTCIDIDIAILYGRLDIIKFIIINRLTILKGRLPKKEGKLLQSIIKINQYHSMQQLQIITNGKDLEMTKWLYGNVVKETSKYYNDFNTYKKYDIHKDLDFLNNYKFSEIYYYLIDRVNNNSNVQKIRDNMTIYNKNMPDRVFKQLLEDSSLECLNSVAKEEGCGNYIIDHGLYVKTIMYCRKNSVSLKNAFKLVKYS
jgi:hypothetical protein